jgi:hypothetical protein
MLVTVARSGATEGKLLHLAACFLERAQPYHPVGRLRRSNKFHSFSWLRLIEELRCSFSRACQFQELQLKLRRVDQGLTYLTNDLGAVNIHRIVLVLERFERLEQVIA